jgi:hypothetical protein
LHLEYASLGLRRVSAIFCGAFVLGLFGYLAVTGNLSLQFLGIYDVYEKRAQFVELTEGSVISGYLAPIYFNVVGPILMGLGLYYRKYWLFVLGMGLQLVLYTSIAYKTVLFAIAAIVALHLFVSRRRSIPSFQFLAAIVGAGVAVSAAEHLLRSDTLTELFVRRLMFVPGMLHSVYAHVFWDAGKTNFQDALPFVQSAAAGSSAADVVAREFFHGSVNPSASLWAHGFGSYGFVGMYAETLVLVVMLWLIDDVTKTLPLVLALSVFLMPSLALCEASVFTALLTHAVGAALVVALLTPRPLRPSTEGSQSASGNRIDA